MTRAEWVRSQIRSPWHWGSMLALWGLGYYTLGWAGRGHMTAAMAGWGLFLLVETAPMLWTMLAFAGAMLFLSRIFPPAAIIFIIVGIVFFILRIRYVIQNAQLLASGFLVYLVYYYLFADHMRLGGKLVEVCYRLLTLGHLIVPPGPSGSCWSIPPCSWPPGCRCSWSICFSGWPTGKGMKAAPLLRCCLACPWW